MPAYNFQARFAPKVADGTKRHTLRAKRKDGWAPIPGQPFRAYTGMRTKQCKPILFSTISKVEWVRIDAEGIVSIVGPWAHQCRTFTHDEREQLAMADGFKDALEFVGFFRDTYGLPFEGHLIHWTFDGCVPVFGTDHRKGK